MSIILANASRWHKTRTLRPKGKRKSAAKGGGRKRRRRYYNLKNLKNQKKCLCADGCICAPPVKIKDSSTQLKISLRNVSVQCDRKSESESKSVQAAVDIADVEAQTDPELTTKTMVDASTEIVQHSYLLPKSGTFTKGDQTKEKCQAAIGRLKKAIPKGFHWSSLMIAVTLRLLYGLIVNFNWQYTRAVHFTADVLNLAPRTVFKFSKDYMDGESNLPNDLVMKVRGRGAAAFIMNHGKDKYSLLKEVS